MNSVALPASASSTTALSAEADLVRQAARGDADAFGEIYRRHSAPAWRLAQALTADRQGATSVFRDGFVRAVRSGRAARRSPGAFRPHVLSAVYRAAMDLASDRTAAPIASRRTVAGGPDAALADAAFRSLPERWRAAVWLNEVENLESDRVAAILGVSSSVAEQLIARGRRGLAGRFAQAHHEVPEHIGEVLRPLAIAAPADLAEVTTARWSAAGADHLSVLAPVSGWLEDRAARPMSVAAGALIGLGLIGLGVVSTSSTVRSQLGAASSSNSSSGAVPVHTCLGLPCPGGTAGTFSAGSGFLSSSFLGGGNGLSGGPGGTFGSTFGGAGGAGSGAFGGGGTFGGVGGTGGTGSTGGTSTSGGSTTPTTQPPSGGTTLGAPGVATISTSSGGTSTNLLGGTATATSGTGGTTAGVGGTTIINTSTTTAAPTTTTTTTTPLSGVTGTLSTTVTTVAGTLSGTTSSLTTIGTGL